MASKKLALLVGNNYSGTAAELRGCHNDVERMRSALEPLGYSCSVLLEATRQQILDALRELVSSGARRLFFHFSGHGSQSLKSFASRARTSGGGSDFPLLGLLARFLGSESLDESDGLDETICGIDAEIVDNEIHTILRTLPPRAQLVSVLDCCHSGTAFDLRYTYQSLSQCSVSGCDDLPARVVLFSGCGDSQTSTDVGGSEPHGAMTAAFLDVLAALPPTAPLQGILKSLRGLLRQRGFSQRPCLSLGYFEDITRSSLAL